MTERSFIIRSADIKLRAAGFLSGLPLDPPHEVVFREFVKIRTTGQNQRYWATLNEELKSLHLEIDIISTHTGYSTLEVRRIVAARLPPEQAAVLFAHKPESVHDILKMIHGVSTTTRLGTKAFMQYEDRMLQTIAEIVGEVRAVSRESA